VSPRGVRCHAVSVRSVSTSSTAVHTSQRTQPLPIINTDCSAVAVYCEQPHEHTDTLSDRSHGHHWAVSCYGNSVGTKYCTDWCAKRNFTVFHSRILINNWLVGTLERYHVDVLDSEQIRTWMDRQSAAVI
jgi:hypothetical protein